MIDKETIADLLGTALQVCVANTWQVRDLGLLLTME